MKGREENINEETGREGNGRRSVAVIVREARVRKEKGTRMFFRFMYRIRMSVSL